MKLRFVGIISGILIMIFGTAGVLFKTRYKDFNKEEAPLDKMIVGIMYDSMIDQQISIIEKGDAGRGLPSIMDSEMILAVECTEHSLFRYRCMTQRVRVLKVFQGDELSPYDEIDVAKSNSGVYCFDKESEDFLIGHYGANMGFASEMTPGKKYLVFLNSNVDNVRGEQIWLLHDNLLPTRFCYDEIANDPVVPISKDYHGAFYEDMKGNEFFLESDNSVQKMAELKARLLQKFPLSQ